jgi:hypothetical protein
MPLPNDINLHLQLGKHGWSQAILWVDGVAKDFRMTHVFSDPLAAICESANELATGSQESKFYWHDEPGTYIWSLSRIDDQQHLLNATVREFAAIIYDDTSRNAVATNTFIVARDFWIQLVIFELEKISKLLSYNNYQIGRVRDEFPSAQLSSLLASLRQSKTIKNT